MSSENKRLLSCHVLRGFLSHLSPPSSNGRADFWLRLNPATTLMFTFSGAAATREVGRGAGGLGAGGDMQRKLLFFFFPPFSSLFFCCETARPHCWRAGLQRSSRQDGIGGGQGGSGANTLWADAARLIISQISAGATIS